MAIDPVTKAIITGGTTILGNIMSNSGKTKRQTRQFQHEKEMYGLETGRMHDFFNMENQRIDKAFHRDKDFFNQSHQNTLEALTLGNEMDMSNQKEMFDYRIQQGMQHGMTAYEMFMGPAAGAGGGTTGSGQTLGNSQSQKDQQMAQAMTQREENRADRMTQLAQTEMQTRAQLAAAEMQADASKYGANQSLIASLGSSYMSSEASKYGADQSAAASQYGADRAATTQMKVARINENLKRWDLSMKSTELYHKTLPMAAQEIQINEARLDKALNEVVTSSPKYQKALKIMTMSVDNSTNSMLQARFGVDVTDAKQMQSLSEKEFRNVLSVFIAAGSKINQELQGLLSLDPFGESSNFNLTPLGQRPGDSNFSLGNQMGQISP
jgi:hypothetical protein